LKAPAGGRKSLRVMMGNKLRELRESMLMSKTELAKQADVSPITISRIEKGLPCRMETQRKILLALGMQLSDKPKLFKD
jgi:DNA-binding XRE family transcriptional regulator